MNNGVTLNFHARAPVRYKKSVVRSFVNRIYNSSSNWSHFHEGLTKAKEYVAKGGSISTIKNKYIGLSNNAI